MAPLIVMLAAWLVRPHDLRPQVCGSRLIR